jgi:hypothetical protein
MYDIPSHFMWGFRDADAVARTVGDCLGLPADLGQLAQRLLSALKDGVAKGDNRYMRVRTDGSPWMASPSPRHSQQVCPPRSLGHALF